MRTKFYFAGHNIVWFVFRPASQRFPSFYVGFAGNSEFVSLFIFILSVMFYLALYLSCLAVQICSLCLHGLFACHFACHKLYAVFLWLYYIVFFTPFVFSFFKIFICQLCIIVYRLVALLLLTCFWIVSSSWLAIEVTVVTLSYVLFYFLHLIVCPFLFIYLRIYRSIAPAVLLGPGYFTCCM